MIGPILICRVLCTQLCSITKMFIVVFLEVVCNAVHVVVKKGQDEQAVCLRCGGSMGPLGGPIYTNVHRQTGVTIVDFERYNMGYKDNFINTYLIQWTVISGRSSRGNYWRFMLVIALLWALMYMVCALIGWANADDSDQFIAWVFLVFIMLVFTIIPIVNITIRRLHDVNQSGWYFLC